MTIREIVFDTETTGFYPDKGDRLVEIGCIELIDKKKTGNNLHLYVNPERNMPDEAFRVHGLSTEFLAQKPVFEDLVQKIVEYIGYDSILVAHNAKFDMKFLNFEMENSGYKKFTNEVVDTLDIAKKKYPGQKNNLDALCVRLGVDGSSRIKHGALLDAELLTEVYLEMTGNSSSNGLNLESGFFSNSSIAKSPHNFNDFLLNVQNKDILPSRNWKISEQELSLHIEFIKNNFSK